MFKLSVFAYIFAFLVLAAFAVVCIKKKRMCATVVCSAIVTLAIVAGVGTLAIDSAHGAKSVITTINIDEANTDSKGRLLMFVSDAQGNTYWGLDGISRVYSGTDAMVRITYLPNTKFILGIELYVGDVPQLSLPGIESARSEYLQIYANNDAWSVACIIVLVAALVFGIPKKEWKFF